MLNPNDSQVEYIVEYMNTFSCLELYTNGMMYMENNVYPFLFSLIVFLSY
jgi:hypothetical protein